MTPMPLVTAAARGPRHSAQPADIELRRLPPAGDRGRPRAGRAGWGTHPPGALFHYNNWDFNALGTIFERCTGRPDVSEHLAHHLFLSARDLGRLGTKMLQGGRWNDRQAESTSIQVDRGAGVQPDYGYLWWLPRLLGRGRFLAIGNFGQYLLCVPPGLVIVHLWAVPDDIILARTQGAPAATPIDSVSPQQFMKVVRTVQAALRP
jgi:CubicO group peptidase (beta-lactamase class C family)